MNSRLDDLMVTQFADEGFNRDFRLKLGQVIDLLHGALGSTLISVHLLGSYGRGMGTVIRKGETLSPANDLDLAIITKSTIPGGALMGLMNDATKMFNPHGQYLKAAYSPLSFHVDMFQFTADSLRTLIPTQFNVDLKYGSALVYGEDIVRDALKFGQHDVPRIEGLYLLLNRIWSLQETVSGDILLKDDPLHQKEFTLYHAKKAVVDSAAALLIARGKYESKFENRIKQLHSVDLSEVYGGSSADMQAVFHLNLVGQSVVETGVSRSEMIRRWNQAREIILRTLNSYLTYFECSSGKTSLTEQIDALFPAWEELMRRSYWEYRTKSDIPGLRAILGFIKKSIIRKEFALKYPYSAGPLLLDSLAVSQNGEVSVDGHGVRTALDYLTRSGIDLENAPPRMSFNRLEDWEKVRNFGVTIWKYLNQVA